MASTGKCYRRCVANIKCTQKYKENYKELFKLSLGWDLLIFLFHDGRYSTKSFNSIKDFCEVALIDFTFPGSLVYGPSNNITTRNIIGCAEVVMIVLIDRIKKSPERCRHFVKQNFVKIRLL